MSSVACCPVCALPISDTWVLLASKARGDDPVDTRVCPGCTLAMTGEVWSSTDPGAGYRARAATGPSVSLYRESDTGAIEVPDLHARRDRLRERVGRLRHAVERFECETAVDVLDVGCQDGVFLATAATVLPIAPVGLEPWMPWRRTSERRGLSMRRTPIERWADDPAHGASRFDVITDFDVLGHMPDPVAHLSAIAAALREHGVAIIEVPNLLGAAGKLDRDILRTETPWSFTPRSLATACLRAGLHPIQMDAGPAITIVCKKGPVTSVPVDGPDALKVAHLAWGNDLRLSAKRTLAKHGPTPRVIRGVARIHKRCPIPAVRADIAIEIAVALERCADYRQSASWLRMSLQDRHDPQVVALLENLRRVQTRMNEMLVAGPAANEAPLEDEQTRPLALAS